MTKPRPHEADGASDQVVLAGRDIWNPTANPLVFQIALLVARYRVPAEMAATLALLAWGAGR